MRSSAHKYTLPLILIFAFAFGITYIFVQTQIYKNKNSEIIPLPTPTPKLISNDVHSEDGTLKVTLETVSSQKTLPVAYVYTSDVLGANKKLLFSKTLETGESFSLSPNAWSPDNKYLFISDWKNNSPGALVFKATGDPFAQDEPYLDVASLFARQKNDLFIRDITGWDSNTLMHVTTKKDIYVKGPSFWFEVPSKAFLQLATL